MEIVALRIVEELEKLNNTATEIKEALNNKDFGDFSDLNGSFQTALRDLSVSLDHRK